MRLERQPRSHRHWRVQRVDTLESFANWCPSRDIAWRAHCPDGVSHPMGPLIHVPFMSNFDASAA
jgi:hypothetical protein